MENVFFWGWKNIFNVKKPLSTFLTTSTILNFLVCFNKNLRISGGNFQHIMVSKKFKIFAVFV